MPDSSSTNELQTLSQSGNVVTLSNGGGSATFTDNDKQQIAINSTKGTISLTNGGTIKLADSSATNEIQSLSISAGKGRIALSNGGSVLLNDSSITNELQKITRNGGRVILDQNGGIISLPDSSSTNELQTITKSLSTVTLSQGGGSFTDDDKQTLSITTVGSNKTVSISNGNNVLINVNDADSSKTNELQLLSISNDTLFITNGNSVKLPHMADSTILNHGVRLGFSSNTSWKCPAGVTSITVELWGGAGGSGGSGAAIAWWGTSGCAGCLVGGVIRGGKGASGGNGGYNVAKLTVVPGNSYFIKVGTGGNGGVNGTVTGNRSGGNGSNGDTSKFGNLLSALPGIGGGGGISIFGTSSYSCSDGVPGAAGNSTGYKPINVQIQGITQIRGYLPTGYVNSTVNASCCAIGGSEPQTVQTGMGGYDGYRGNTGESGYCVIHY